MTRRDDSLVALATLLPLAVLLIAERRIAGAAGFPLDDAWIHLHFARNLIEGAGFSYNPGTPVAGSTAPLWTLLVAATAAIAGPSVLAVKTLGVVLTAVAGVLTRRAAAAAGAPRAIALAAGIALVWAGPVAWGALSGMEVPLAALLVAGALLAHVEDRALATAVLAALAVLARPEALLLVPLFAIARPPAIRRVMIFAAVTAVLVAPAVFFSLRTVGTAVPATAAAKVEGGLLGFLAGVREPVTLTFAARPWAFLVEWIRWLAMTQWLLPLALVPGLLLVWRRGGRALGIVALALVAHPLGMALLAPYRGPAFQEGRYSIHVLPIVLVTLAVTLGPLVTNRASVVAALALALSLVPLPRAAERYAWGVQNINAMQVHLGRWVDANVAKGARLAVNDVGAIAYFSRREVIDLMGLVTPGIIPYRREGEGGVIRYLVEACPDYVIVFPAWFPTLTTRHEMLEPLYRVRLERNLVSGGPEMVVYRLTRCTV